ncbi:NnrU family protein [Alteraurantiacibacter palmitatis]|uniref:NnrU family protein n=1 Tax=Alteraurantiacibacter palmitatis TaxID=2054628 RepID=A0ABV7E936_9SPHN
MTSELTQLLLANAAFVGSHFAMSHPMRTPMVRVLGPSGFLGVYSLASLALLYWVVQAFQAAPPADLGGSGAIGWLLATALTLPAMVLLAGSFAGNPALPDPTGKVKIPAEPRGVFRVTRHPMMWGIGLWAIAHVALWWSTRTLITASAMGVLALLGAHLQDRKKRGLLGEAWAGWQAQTSYWPKWSAFARIGWVWWLAGGAIWLVATFAHMPLGGIPAGIWRWMG